jgi:hypothetical protein
MSGPISGRGSRDEGDKTHEWAWWKDDKGDETRHSESYDVDKDGNISNLHYTQTDESDGSQIVYDYHNDEWQDNTE